MADELEELPVICRVWTDTESKKESALVRIDGIMLFPTIPVNDDRPDLCDAWMCVGGHGAASFEVVDAKSRMATPDEVEYLISRYDRIQDDACRFKLIPVRRETKTHIKMRRKELGLD